LKRFAFFFFFFSRDVWSEKNQRRRGQSTSIHVRDRLLRLADLFQSHFLVSARPRHHATALAALVIRRSGVTKKSSFLIWVFLKNCFFGREEKTSPKGSKSGWNTGNESASPIARRRSRSFLGQSNEEMGLKNEPPLTSQELGLLFIPNQVQCGAIE
jgi:hypothetical protein